MAEKYSELSPYNYALNNPVIYVDPDGNEVEMCCDGLKGFLVGLADNVAGTNLRSNYGGSDFNDGAKLADVVSVIGGTMLQGKGLSDMAAGAGGLSNSVAVTAGSGGLAIEVTAPAAAASGVLIGKGAIEFGAGSNIVSNAMSNLKNGNSSSDKNSDGGSTKGSSKGSLSETKSAVKEAKEKIGLKSNESLPKGEQGKFGSPQRGDAKKGYRLDPSHPNAKPGSGEEFPHVNYWDYSNGKRGNGGIQGAIPIKK